MKERKAIKVVTLVKLKPNEVIDLEENKDIKVLPFKTLIKDKLPLKNSTKTTYENLFHSKYFTTNNFTLSIEEIVSIWKDRNLRDVKLVADENPKLVYLTFKEQFTPYDMFNPKGLFSSKLKGDNTHLVTIAKVIGYLK